MLECYRGDAMNILICDDNAAFAAQLQKDISEYFHNPHMNINVITDHFDQIEGRYDIIFMDIELNDKQIEQFETYRKLLQEYNKVMNLTAIIETEEIYVKHFYD